MIVDCGHLQLNVTCFAKILTTYKRVSSNGNPNHSPTFSWKSSYTVELAKAAKDTHIVVEKRERENVIVAPARIE